MQITQPLQNFPLNYGRPGYVLAAGGIGITALVAMGKALKARGADYRFVYGARSRSLMAFVDELVAEHGDRMDLRIDDEGGRSMSTSWSRRCPRAGSCTCAGPPRCSTRSRRRGRGPGGGPRSCGSRPSGQRSLRP